MRLKLDKNIVTRYQVQHLAEDYPDTTEIDWNGHEAYSASAIDELIRRFPNAVHINVSDYTRREMAWVLNVIGKDDVS